MKTMLLTAFLSTSLMAQEVKPITQDSPHPGETTGAKETVCKQDTRVRKVLLTTGEDGLACKVSYLKESEAPGEEKVLWSAKQKADYCQGQAVAFVEKLKAMGWACE